MTQECLMHAMSFFTFRIKTLNYALIFPILSAPAMGQRAGLNSLESGTRN